jgi:CRISPR-associated endonuclease/helicase Cas3
MEDTDRRHIQDLRRSLDYPKTAREFRLIEDDTVSVVVAYGDEHERRQVEQAWQALETKSGNLRKLLRLLQPYTVSLYQHQAKKYLGSGWIQPSAVLPELGLWLGEYHPVRGLVADLPADRLIF